MKKLILSTIFVGTFAFFANADVHYVQFNYYNNYIDNYNKRVLKCSYSGDKFCEPEIQLPCKEACGLSIPPTVE